MTKIELLKIVVGQARENGFDFRRWYEAELGLKWTNAETAFTSLEKHRQYYALLFSHEFASAFWKPGSAITFQVAQQTFQRTMPDGSVSTITRKAFTRRSTRKNVWRYHLREMAVAEDPLRYIRKYLRVEDELEKESEPRLASAVAAAKPPRRNLSPQTTKRVPKPLPSGLPAFLRRPYP